ncbi:MAG TPA: hypothetical protein VGU20_31370 [Stellaceae bacterium]|nr:hypothetical protein [Stellaceae bacterium]
MVLLALVGVGVIGWIERRPLLQSIADAWIVSDQIAPADVVAVFGGGLEDRPFAAAYYYRKGLVRTVLLSNVHVGPAGHLGAFPTHVVAAREILSKLGVPESAVETFGNDLSNTHDEVLALRAWAEHAGARSIIVPTEIFPARRVRWMLHRVFSEDMTIRVVALDPLEYRRDDWWQHEEGIVSLQNEILKYLYYRIRY